MFIKSMLKCFNFNTRYRASTDASTNVLILTSCITNIKCNFLKMIGLFYQTAIIPITLQLYIDNQGLYMFRIIPPF